jgi:hypothetical protein
MDALTGNDVIKLDDRNLVNLADGDCVTLEFPNEIGNVKTGKNGNSLFAFNNSGLNVKVKLRMLIGSPDDKYMNSRLAEWINDPAAFTLFTGQFVKRTGDGNGTVQSVTYNVSGGIPTKIPAAKENAEGDTEQAVIVWELTFSNAPRTIS